MNEELLWHFERLSPYIEEALAYAGGTHTVADVRRLCEEHQLQFWPAAESVVVTELIDTPQARTLHFFLAGGNLSEIKQLYHHILAWGRERGCTKATLAGRPGWQRTFLTKTEGWTAPLVLMTKDL